MGTRGKKSATALESASLKLMPRRPLAPPRDMPRAQRVVWREVTSSFAADFFSAVDRPLLACYCDAAVQAAKLAAILEHDGLLVNTAAGGAKVHPASYALSNATAVLCRLATKLRIAPSARYRADTAATRANAAPASKRPWA